MRRSIFAAAVAGLTLLGGGTTMKTEEYWSKDYGVKALRPDDNSAAMKLRAAIDKSGGNTKGVVDAECFNVSVGTGNETKCQQRHNAALATLMVASDDLCQDHLRTIYGNEAYYNILTRSVATLSSLSIRRHGDITRSALCTARVWTEERKDGHFVARRASGGE